MSTVTAVDPHWLAELGGVFYSVKEKGYSAKEKRITEHEFNRKMEIEATMAEDKARVEDAAKIKAEEMAIHGARPHSVVVKRMATQGVVRRPQTPMMRKRGI